MRHSLAVALSWSLVSSLSSLSFGGACATAPVAPPVYMASAPVIPPVKSFVPPAPDRFTLANGLQVVVIEKHATPLVAMTLLVKSGGAEVPADKAGLAALTADLLVEGAGTRNALEIAQALESLGASLDTSASPDSSTVSMLVLSSHLDEASALFADTVLRPLFAARDVERVRGETVAALLQQKARPQAVAGLAIATALYGDSGYGRAVDGYSGTVAKLNPGDVRDFWGTYYRPNNAVLIVVGDVTAADARARVEKLFGAWQPRPVTASAPPAPLATRPRVVLIDKPAAPQSVVMVAEPTTTRASADYAALDAVSMVLGGSFTSRLERNLRERNNYTYGAHASVSWRRGVSAFVASADIFTAVTGPALAELMKELVAVHGPISEEEFDKARALRRQALVEYLGSAQTTATVVANLVSEGLPVDAYRDLDAKIGALTPDDLTRVTTTYLHPDRMTIVVVGDLAKIRPAIEALDLGKIEIQTTDGL